MSSNSRPRRPASSGRRQFLATGMGAALAAAFPAGLIPARLWADPGELQTVLRRLQQLTLLPLTLWRYHAPGLAHGEAPALDDSAWQVVKFQPRRRRGHPHRAGWYRARIQVPASIGGFDARNAELRFALGGGPLLRVFFNGGLVAQGDSNSLTPVPFPPYQPGRSVLVAIEVVDQKGPGSGRLYGAGLLARYPHAAVDPGDLRAELAAANLLGKGFQQPQVASAARSAAAAVRLDQLPAAPAAFARSLAGARDRLAAARPWEKSLLIRAVGNSHIDLAWLWPWTEAVEVVRDTFATVLELMREYPDFRFAQSSARDFAWLEQKYPPLFKAIQQRVKEGRWEMVGGMWCEPDLNMPDGESLVRQLLVGKRYFQQKFGVDVRIGWNPDSFGYSWQLPQIYKRSGVDYFVTQKLLWNDTTPPAHTLFWWESPDGSRVLTYFPHDYANGTDPIVMARNFAAFAPQKVMMHLYGVGDHGGGPTREMLDNLQRWRRPEKIYPRIVDSTAQEFFDQVQPQAASLPVWKSELYLQFHRGTYTSQARLKHDMRRSEELLQNAEKFCALAAALYRRPYPQARLEDGWKRVLFDQFHDVMAGSGIAVNYRDAAENLRTARLLNQPELDASQREIAARIDTRGPGAPVVVFNPLSWARTDAVELEAELPRPAARAAVRDASGRLWPSQVLRRDAGGSRFRLLALAENVPALGYRVAHVAGHSGRVSAPATSLKFSRYALENEFFRLRVNPRTGNLASLLDKRTGREAFAPGVYRGRTLAAAKKGHRHAWAAPLSPLPAEGNVLQFFHDLAANWDAWNIEADYERHPLGPVTVEGIELIERGPVRAALRVVRRFQNSRFEQELRVVAGVPRLDVFTRADWREKHVLCKVAFPLNVRTRWATYEIPYGTIRRAANPQTPAEMAEWEVPAQRWADLSQATGANGRAGYGAALLNRSKFGYDCHGNVLRLTLLRSPAWPDPDADQGRHEFLYSFFPHAGGWLAGGVMRQGWQLNYPLMPLAEEAHAGALPAGHAFFSVEPENVILSVVKKAEDDEALILRCYEYAGRAAQLRLRLPAPAARAAETNLMEKEERPLPLSPGARALALPIGAYEIKTLKLWLRP